jgi:hypothetical protein
MTLEYTSTVYNGKAKTPVPTLYYTNGNKKTKLVKGTDYTVSYLYNTNMGQGYCVVKGTKNYTGTIKQSFRIIPPQITGVKVTSTGANSVSLSWNKVNGVSGYQVVRYDAAKKKYIQVKRVTSNTASCTVTGLSSSTPCRYWVRAYIQSKDGKNLFYGVYSKDIYTSTTPSRVTLKSVSKSGTSVKVNWSTTKCTGYQIFYSTDSKFSKNVKYVNVNNSSTSSYTLKNLGKNTNYYIKVRAFYRYNGGLYKSYFSNIMGTYYSNLYATYSSNYVNNANRTTNLTIASNAITGTIVKPGETFSFNDVVGPRTAAKGYKDAPIFSGSGTTNGTGGGICQVASTMFNCVLLSNVQIVERHQHSQRVSYVPLGRDAAIYGTTQDLKWKNNTNYNIRVVMTVKDGVITCSFYTCEKVQPASVQISVTQSGNNFTMYRKVNGTVNYSCKSKY